MGDSPNSLRPTADSSPGSSSSLRPAASGDQKQQSSQKKSDKEKAPPLTPEVVNWYVAELRYRTALYLEFVQAMMDGVTLGAEQVQDKRLEFSQEVPETGLGAEIFIFALTLILEGTIGPAIAAAATAVVLAPLMKSAARAFNIATGRNESLKYLLFRRQANALSNEAMRSENPSLSSADRVRKILDAQRLNLAADQIKSTAPQQRSQSIATVNALINFTRDNLVALTKSSVAVANVPGASAPSSASNDTASVAIRGAAMASASQLRLTVRAIHEAIETNLRDPSMTKDTADQLLTDYWIEGPCQYDVLRDSYQLTTEAMIWGRILFPGMDAGAPSITDIRKGLVRGNPNYPLILEQDPNIGGPGFGRVPGMSDAATNYLAARFSDEISRWALESNAHGPHELGPQVAPRPTGWWESLPQRSKIDFLVQYLQMVSKKTPRELVIRSST